MQWFYSLHPVLQGLFAAFFAYFITALGASVVFFFRSMNKSVLNFMMGSAAGIMLAASFWSLLSPAIELSAELGYSWIVVCLGFLCGGGFVLLSDAVLSRASRNKTGEVSRRRSILLTGAVTMHNIPEGLAIGVAFGSVYAGIEGATIAAALALALGIGIQDFPEGACVALPLLNDGNSRLRSFLIGQASGIVEPIAGVLGVLFAMAVRSALPIALSFSAGAMITVVCAELIPDSFRESKTVATVGVMLGFALMMVLDVTL